MRQGNDRDTLRARFTSNAPDVDVRGDWATVHARLLARSEKKPRRRTRFLLVSFAVTCVIAALVVGAVLAFARLGKSDFVVIIGDAPTVETVEGTEGSSTTVTTEFQVGADSLSTAWLKVGEVVEFDVAHAHCDQLEIDYTPAGGVKRVFIHAYTDRGEVVARSDGASASDGRLELAVTLTRSDAASEHGVDSSPVISILSALDAVEMKEMIARFAETKLGDVYQKELYRVTTAFALLGREDLPVKETAYIWHPDSLFSELPPEDERRQASPLYVHLAMIAYPRDLGSESASTTLESLPHIYLVLPIPKESASEAASEKTGVAVRLIDTKTEGHKETITGAVAASAETTEALPTETPEVTISP